MATNIWYAYQMDAEDNSWDGDGSTNRADAIAWLREQMESGNSEARVAVIDSDDSFCMEEIHTSDI